VINKWAYIRVGLYLEWGECRAAERLAGALGKFFLRGPYIQNIFPETNFFRWTTSPSPPWSPKNFPSVYHFRGRKFFWTSTLQLLSRDFISFFYAKFWYLAQKNSHLVLCAEIFNTQKRLGPNKKFSGAPSTLGARGNLPPPLCGPGWALVPVVGLYTGGEGVIFWGYSTQIVIEYKTMVTPKNRHFNILAFS
jgi:hypothetical protein